MLHFAALQRLQNRISPCSLIFILVARKGPKELDDIADRLLSASPPGGIIFIDEAGQLLDGGGAGQGQAAMSVVHRIIKLAEDHRKDLTIMLSGYKKQMEALMATDPGLSSRFPQARIGCIALVSFSSAVNFFNVHHYYFCLDFATAGSCVLFFVALIGAYTRLLRPSLLLFFP